MSEIGIWLRKKQTDETKPKTKSTKLSKTPWIILFLRVGPVCCISTSLDTSKLYIAVKKLN